MQWSEEEDSRSGAPTEPSTELPPAAVAQVQEPASGMAKEAGVGPTKRKGRHKMCEDCSMKQPSFGLPAEGKVRWCGGCAKAHAGVVNVNARNKKCEDCSLKQSTFGIPVEGKKKAEQESEDSTK